VEKVVERMGDWDGCMRWVVLDLDEEDGGRKRKEERERMIYNTTV